MLLERGATVLYVYDDEPGYAAMSAWWQGRYTTKTIHDGGTRGPIGFCVVLPPALADRMLGEFRDAFADAREG